MKTFEKTFNLAVDYFNGYKPVSSYDYKRVAYIIDLLERTKTQGYKDAGVLGKVVEVCSRPSTSRLISVQPSSKFDCRWKVGDNTSRLEIKVGSGRIGDLEKIAKPEQVQVHYLQAFYNHKGQYFERNVVLRLDRFLDLINEIGCYSFIEHKEYLTSDKEKNVRGDSMKLYKALENELPFNREMVYIKEDFE